ncbi:hypothetical protein [Campylobacter helveticus]|nr:hypothetical protein [Campylobacter helveticus]
MRVYKPSGIEWIDGGGGVKSQPIGNLSHFRLFLIKEMSKIII